MNIVYKPRTSTLRRSIFLVLLPLFSLTAFAQPSNDNCNNAHVINIPNGGFALGTFNSDTVDLTAATVQPGEAFAPTLLIAGLNQKSVWYKFTLPTTRDVSVKLAQPGPNINSTDAGFTVYKTSTCLPATSDISSKLTPHEGFDSTRNPCVDWGVYLVQVSAKAAANGPVYIVITISPTIAAYDKPSQAYDFGTLAVGYSTATYGVDCQSMEDGAEICSTLGNYQQYNKTTWHVFKTPAYFDYISLYLIHQTNGNQKFGYKIYQGDVRTNSYTSLPVVVGCDSLLTTYVPNVTFGARKVFGCGLFNPNTTYSIQLFYKQDFNDNIMLTLFDNGETPTQAPQPILSAIPAPSNALGILPSSPTGIVTARSDYFGCNSRHSIHPCPPSLLGGGTPFYFNYQNYRYDLSTFFTFTLSTTSSLTIGTSSNCGYPFLLRLFQQDVSNNCATLDTMNIVGQILTGGTLNCLAPGQYTLQVMGTDTTQSNFYGWGAFPGNSTAPSCFLNHLGQKFDLVINAKSIAAQNKYSLNVAGAFDTIGPVSATVQPLLNGVTYLSHTDMFGCANTVLPWDTVCAAGNTKAVYREFLVADSGIISITNYYNNNWNKLYKGDADALATAQNVHSYPLRITGLDPRSTCYKFAGGCTGLQTCITPGIYSHVVYGSNSDIGQTTQHSYNFSVVNTAHDSPLNAENMGTLNPGGTLTSGIDYFSCKDNAVPINGYQPCTFGPDAATKAIYRQFYLSAASTITASANVYIPGCYGNYPVGMMTIFSGKASDGLGGLTPLPYPFRCFQNASSNGTCVVLDSGWYSIVTYGNGPSYTDPFQGLNQSYGYSSLLGYPTKVTISAQAACPASKFNRPYKAAIDNSTGQPFLIQWGPHAGNTAAYPRTDTTYTLPTENFSCSVDVPFTTNLVNCNAAINKVAYYVFRLTQECYVQIDTKYSWGAVYSGNARTADSSLFGPSTLIQPCIQFAGDIQICKLQPGDYTLTVFGLSSDNCLSFAPTIYVDQVGSSRFDHANKAYDFGLIPPDSLYHNGKVGDINPLDPGRAPSNDFIFCTTGSQLSDPADPVGCGPYYSSQIYSGGVNTPVYNGTPYATANGFTPRRNLWYTFVVDRGGYVRVRVDNKTIGKSYPYWFHVYKSDVDATLPFSTIVNNGLVDSTLNQGLTLVANNQRTYYWLYCPDRPNEVSFYRSACSPTPERYYIVVDNPNTYPYDFTGMRPNSQLEVSILMDSVNIPQPLFDHYSQAYNIGNNLGSGSYQGATDNYSCATRDATDPTIASSACANKTLWYKFSTSVTGHLKFRVVVNGQSGQTSYWTWDNIAIFRQIIPNDSTSNGLQVINSSNNGIYDPAIGTYWGLQCVSPGTYYMMLSGCNMTAEYEHPDIQITEEVGDFCSRPVIASLNGTGSTVASAIIDCHTIGTDYGEFNPTLTCPPGAITNQYKTSWFRIDISGTDTVDLTTYLTENTTATSSQIKYRLMNGDCSAMQERSCVQDALTQDTYKCLRQGSYWIQVFSPAAATGTIDLHVLAVPHADTCAPPPPCLANANFQTQLNCATDQSVSFINYSTFGSAITYNWNFGYNGQTSNAVAPQFNYPALAAAQTYTVTLTVNNSNCGASGTVVYSAPVTVPGRPNVNLGNDTTICAAGSTLQLNATTWSGTTYQWQNGSTSPILNVSASGTYWVTATYNGCVKKDTIVVQINPITRLLQTKYLCGNDSVLLNSARGQGESYAWNTGATTPSIYAKTAGTYINTLTWNGCTTRDTFNVLNAVAPFAKNDTTICYPFHSFVLSAVTPGAISYQWQNNSTASTYNVTVPGTYWVSVGNGTCFKRDTINVLVSPQPLDQSSSAFICQGQSYTLPWGTVVNASGVYRDTLRNAAGCDSVRRSVNLTVQSVTSLITNPTICAGSNYILPWGTIVANAGTYYDTLHYSTGCDSVRRIVNLTVQSPASQIFNPIICQGQTYTLPWGQIVGTTGAYHDTLHYSTGCDSIRRTVNLTVQIAVSQLTNATICEGSTYTLPWGTVVSTTGSYHDTLRYVTGCDSIRRTFNLIVQVAVIQITNPVICEGQSYTLPWGQVVNTPGVYRDTLHSQAGCDSIRREVNLTYQVATLQTANTVICEGQSYTLPWGVVVNTPGIYRDTLHTAFGCDSVRREVNLAVQTASLQNFNPVICDGQSYTLPWGTVVNAAGVYRDTLHYSTGCDSVRRVVNLTIQSFTNQISNPIICDGSTYTLPWGTVVGTEGIYRDTLHYTSGCDSIRRTVNLTVQQASAQTFNAVICQGSSFTLPWGIIVNTPGTYHDTLHYTTGCDSVRRTVNLTVQTPSTQTFNPVICEGSTYTLPWGIIVNVTGIYRDTLHYVTGCDSIRRTVNLTVQPITSQVFNPIICQGSTYTLPWGAVVNTAGIYRDTLHYTSGCDSVRRIVNLTVQSPSVQSFNAVICEGSSYTLPWGTIVNTAGIYHDTLHYTTGCDSIRRTVDLTVQTAALQVINATICAGSSYTLPWGAVVSTTGVYKDTLYYATGCDSIRRIVNLTVQVSTIQTFNPVICQGSSYTLPWGTIVNTPGIYRDTLHYTTGCDSVRQTVNLTVQTAASTIANVTICAGQSYTLPWGTVVNASGIYRDTLYYITGCDSIRRTINLTVQSSLTQTTNAVICQGASYTLPWGTTVNTAGIYRDTLHYITGCDSVRRIVNLQVTAAAVTTINATICSDETYALPWGSVVNTAGIYRDTVRTAFGCDSLVRTVNLTVNPAPSVTVTRSNDVDCMLGTSKLQASGGIGYSWSPAGTLNNSTIYNPVASPFATTWYKVVVTSDKGCTTEDSIQVKVVAGNIQNGYLVPNAFTPNHDGKNDCFGVQAWGSVTDFSLSIYNRWGQRIYYTTRTSDCWDGTYKGVEQNPEVYVYVITGKGLCGKIDRKGTFVLIR